MLYNSFNDDVLEDSMSKDTSKKPEDKKLKKFLGYFDESWNYAQQNYHATWDRNWKLYHNMRTKRNHPGTIETFVPMVNSTVNTIVASLFNSNPSVRYIPNDNSQASDTEVLNDVYADFAKRDNWVQKNKINGRQGLITGNFCAYYEWLPSKDGGYVHKEIVPIRDMIIDPQSTDYTNWRYVGRRFFTSKKALEKATIYDLKQGKNVKRYKNLDKIISGDSGDRESDKTKKDQLIGSTVDNKDVVACIEIWTPKEVVVIANRSTIIEARENPHYLVAKSKFEQRKLQYEIARLERLTETGEDMGDFDLEFNEEEARLLPFAHGTDYKDISLVYGTSDVDIIADQQELLNTLTELNIEAELYTLFPEKTLDPKFANAVDDLSPKPGKVYPLPAGAMEWNSAPVIPNSAFVERQNIKDEIREVSAVSQISKGVTATDSTTATEIKAMLGQADIRIQEKAQNLADDFFFQEAKIVLKLLQLYAPDTMYVRSIADAGVSFNEVSMDKFIGEYTPMVTLDVQNKLEKAEKQEAYTRAFQMIIQDPTNNLENAKRIMYRKIMPELSSDEIEQIITPAQPQEAPMQAPEMPAQEQIEPIYQDSEINSGE